ncbi:MAG: hypothetical protein ABI237_05925 [Ginsengibacter sp.]
MRPNEQKASIASLKEILFQQIDGQEVNEKLYRRILRRLSFISVFLSMTVLGGIFFIIFSISQPKSILNKTLQAKNDLDSINFIQFKIMKLNTQTIIRNVIKIDSLRKQLEDEKLKNK